MSVCLCFALPMVGVFCMYIRRVVFFLSQSADRIDDPQKTGFLPFFHPHPQPSLRLHTHARTHHTHHTQHTHLHSTQIHIFYTFFTMALYPSLEDKNVDQMVQAEVGAAQIASALHSAPVAAALTSGGAAAAGSPYAGLMAEMNEFDSAFGGLALDQTALALHMPQDHVSSWMVQYNTKSQPLATVTPASDRGIMRAAIRQGVREVVLAKDAKGLLGLAVDAWDKGVFVAFVWKDSASALGGLRFGDQIVEINNTAVAGWTAKKTLKFLRDAEPTRVQVAVRDRPFMRTVTCQKDSTNHCGFMFKDGEIQAIVKDSSAARNGLMIHHQIVEVNGQSVVGLKDKELQIVLQQSPMTTTVTITPRFVFKHLIKKIGWKRIKGFSDHSIPMEL